MYQCMFPGCDYQVKDREKIDNHHIVPKELGGSDKHFNRILLCPVHHRCVYVPSAKVGLHSFKREGAIIIQGYMKSTAGKGLIYTNCDDGKEYVYIYSKLESVCLYD